MYCTFIGTLMSSLHLCIFFFKFPKSTVIVSKIYIYFTPYEIIKIFIFISAENLQYFYRLLQPIKKKQEKKLEETFFEKKERKKLDLHRRSR